MEILRLEQISKKFDNKQVLKNISFGIEKGEFVSVLGPSGCGKTTLLNILIGALKPDSGKIFMEERDITLLSSSKRKMGIVFQNYALFPNMSALRNVEYALSIKKETKKTARATAEQLLEKVGLTEHKDKKPSNLSGGQQQRVAIARTLALNPEIILFDEPMSALDVTTRLMLRDVILDIKKDFGVTMIYITHDQEEAFSMSDRILVMSEGNIEQYDKPDEIIKNPANDYVKEFVVDQITKKLNVLSKLVGEKNESET